MLVILTWSGYSKYVLSTAHAYGRITDKINVIGTEIKCKHLNTS
jgi:hypothetical protein